MKFVAKYLNWIGLFLLVSFAAAAAGLYWNVPQRLQKRPQPAVSTYETKSGCCENHEAAKAPAAIATTETCPHLAATQSGCGNGCSHSQP